MLSRQYLPGLLTLASLAVCTTAATQGAADAPKPGEVVEVDIAKGVKMKFCWVPAGKATLGSPATEKARYADENEHPFATKGFWLGKFTVTQGEFAAVMGGKNPSYFVPAQYDFKRAGITDTSRFPVDQVSVEECQALIAKLNESVKMPGPLGKGKFCLPFEDEWEYAARGGRGNKQAYYFGDELNGTLANCNGNYPYGTATKGDYKERPMPVGSYEDKEDGGAKARHPWGLCDMTGNVSQWCDRKENDKSDVQVLRGGSWYGYAGFCRSAFRRWNLADRHNNYNGFRVCFRPE